MIPENLSGQFDVIYTSRGVINWLPDLDRWGEVVAHFLKPGGVFYLLESHPVLYIFDDTEPGPLKDHLSVFPSYDSNGVGRRFARLR